MGVRTRSAQSSPAKKTITEELNSSKPKQHEPLKVLIAPRAVSPESRLLELKHPRDSVPKKFLFCPQNGLCELTKFAASPLDPRSLLFSQTDHDTCLMEEHKPKGSDTPSTDRSNASISDGYINRDADMLVATPFDIVFLLLRVVAPQSISTKKAMYQPIDDILDIPETEDKHFRHVLEKGRILIEEAMGKICDTVDAGDEKMFRYNESKVVQLILDKASRVVQRGLPSSLEERFVTRALEAPVVSVQREETITTVTESISIPDESFDSQSSVASSKVSGVFSEVSTTSAVMTAAEDICTTHNFHKLQRTRIAFNFIAASYLPASLAERLQKILSSKDSPIDFQPLDDHLKELTALRNAALVSRSISDYSQKRGHADDDEAAEARAEKKRKQEEEERKQKANVSRGVRDLKKVNVSGMKKMSDFFGKKPALTKAKT